MNIQALIEALGEDAVLTSAQAAERATSYWDSAPMAAKALVRPSNTQEVSQVLKMCHAAGQSVVVQGGRSGCVEGAVSTSENVVISMERMAQIEEIDEMGYTATVGAGVLLQTFQETVAAKGLYFPLDLGARGSCVIGGNVATNAGGINVIRYGMMRNLVLGLEAVLADGTVISSMNRMMKNNSGYDLKQLFIGTEGTLGIVTRVVLKLETAHLSRNTALVAMETFDQVTELLGHVKKFMGSSLSAYEVMWGDYFQAVTEEGWHRSPMDRGHGYYVVIECEGTDVESDTDRFMNVLETAFEAEIIVDAVVPKSASERSAIWNIREDFEAILVEKPYFLYDVTLPIKHMDHYIQEVQSGLKSLWPSSHCFVLGHIGDGNLHLFVKPGFDADNLHDLSDQEVYRPLVKYGGAISAEHGIGKEKRSWLNICRSEDEIALMRTLKAALDPKNILNPDVVI